ncbi:hypothetical protein [Mesobacillus maritimus]|jgi:hypothetical protein|uniref:DUF4234 domain-containing protein n=1 Tax=Mesobacillus maritimus TaxID=1643336 RepID=A0ABS7KB27_9BACI|nr:hypothetical protein [Mesobacillus maritimus]MBY0099415.1 hypothetical protein [Mesobacillus maritimus]
MVVIKIKTLALYIFGFVRFVILVISIVLSMWFFIVAIFSGIAAIGETQEEWVYVLTQYLYFLVCALVIGLMNEFEKKINNEDYDISTNMWLLDLYMLILIAHYELPKKLLMKMMGSSK